MSGSAGFTVYVVWANQGQLPKKSRPSPVTPDEAKGHNWHINWVGIGP